METPVEKRRILQRDWDQCADFIIEELNRRKRARAHLELLWGEVDRQIAMKVRPKDEAAPKWTPNLPLPWQAEALELLVADGRRLLFPDDRNFFTAHASVSNKELAKLDFQSFIEGADIDPGARGIDARGPFEFASDLVEGVLSYMHSQYDLKGNWDQFNAENFKYGTAAGCLRIVEDDQFPDDLKGIYRKRKKYAAFVPQSMWETYLDDAPSLVMNEGIVVAPGQIRERMMLLSDALMAARHGGSDPEKMTGGWMGSVLEAMEPLREPAGHVRVVDYEGDIIIPRKSGPDIFLPNVIVTVAIGVGSPKICRYRENPFPFNAYIVGNYQKDDPRSVYGTSPLIKGAPIHEGGAMLYNSMLTAAALNALPPMRYAPDDHMLAAQGGPQLEPGAQWEALTMPEAVETGNVEALTRSWLITQAQYADVTGITAPRLGQQTKSHQTAFAVDAEQTRGLTRTINYIRGVMSDPMNRFLYMEYAWAKRNNTTMRVHLPEYNAWVDVKGSQLPNDVQIDVTGSGGPLEEREKLARKAQAIQLFMQLEGPARQLGATPGNIDNMRREILRDGGIVDTEAYFSAPIAPAGPPGLLGGPQPEPAVQGAGEPLPPDAAPPVEPEPVE